MTPAQRKKSGATRAEKRAANRNARNVKYNKKIDKKIRKVKGRSTKKLERRARMVNANAYKDDKGNVYLNSYGVYHYQKGAKTAVKSGRKMAKLKSKKRPVTRKRS